MNPIMTHVAFSTSIAHVIQLAVAPVFMLTSVGAFLTVLTNRLSRVIDRARKLDELHKQNPDELVLKELSVLARRARLINGAISLFTSGALVTCVMIAMLFIADYVVWDASLLVASLFILSMFCLICGLLLLQREIYLDIRTLELMTD